MKARNERKSDKNYANCWAWWPRPLAHLCALLGGVGLLSLAACRGGETAGGGFTLESTASGERVAFDSLPQRIVLLGQAPAELTVALQRTDRIVATQQTPTPPAPFARVVQLPTQPVLDFALLKGLQPDALVVDTAQLGSQLVLLRKWATQQQLPLLVQNYQYLEAYAENARQLGTLLDNRTAAEALGNRFLRLVDSVRTRTAAFPRKQVLVLLDIRPQDGYVTAVAGGHVLDKVVRAAGGDNPFSQTPQPLVVVSPEMLLRTQPDAVFLPDGQEENLAALIGLLPQVANWPAVQQSQLFAFAPEQYLATGTSLIATLLEIAQSLHPEASTERAFEQIFK